MAASASVPQASPSVGGGEGRDLLQPVRAGPTKGEVAVGARRTKTRWLAVVGRRTWRQGAGPRGRPVVHTPKSTLSYPQDYRPTPACRSTTGESGPLPTGRRRGSMATSQTRAAPSGPERRRPRTFGSVGSAGGSSVGQRHSPSKQGVLRSSPSPPMQRERAQRRARDRAGTWGQPDGEGWPQCQAQRPSRPRTGRPARRIIAGWEKIREVRPACIALMDEGGEGAGCPWPRSNRGARVRVSALRHGEESDTINGPGWGLV